MVRSSSGLITENEVMVHEYGIINKACIPIFGEKASNDWMTNVGQMMSALVSYILSKQTKANLN